MEVAIGMDSSVSIVRLLLVQNYYACALVLIVQDHMIKFKLFQNGGTFLLVGDMPVLPMVWVKTVKLQSLLFDTTGLIYHCLKGFAALMVNGLHLHRESFSI